MKEKFRGNLKPKGGGIYLQFFTSFALSSCFAFQLQFSEFPLGCADAIFSAFYFVFHLFHPKQGNHYYASYAYCPKSIRYLLSGASHWSPCSGLIDSLIMKFPVKLRVIFFDPKISHLVWNPMHSGTASGVINGWLAGYSVAITKENKCLRTLNLESLRKH